MSDVTGSSATDLIIGSVIIISGSAIIKDTADPKIGFSMKPLIAGFLLGSALLLVAFVSPSIAKGLALLGIVGAVTTNGPAVFKLVGGLTN